MAYLSSVASIRTEYKPGQARALPKLMVLPPTRVLLVILEYNSLPAACLSFPIHTVRRRVEEASLRLLL